MPGVIGPGSYKCLRRDLVESVIFHSGKDQAVPLFDLLDEGSWDRGSFPSRRISHYARPRLTRWSNCEGKFFTQGPPEF